MARKFIRIVGLSHYTERLYVEVDGEYSVFDYMNYNWKPNLTPITQEEVVIDQLMGEWEEVDEVFCNTMELGKAANGRVPWRWKGDDPTATEHRLEINLMAAERRNMGRIRRFVILCSLKLRGIQPPWKTPTKEKPGTDSEEL